MPNELDIVRDVYDQSLVKLVMDAQVSVISGERIERAIILIRGEKVMLDSDLAEIYGVETKRLNEQVRRNLNRFPTDFMFQLTTGEAKCLGSLSTLKGVASGFRFSPEGRCSVRPVAGNCRATGSTLHLL
jgi:hypothetical protein